MNGFRTPRALRHLAITVAGLLAAPTLAAGQETPEPPARLSLPDAVDIALRHNPTYRSDLNDIGLAEWDVREAWGALLPGASASAGFQYQAEGQFRLGAVTGSELGVGISPASYLSDYFFGFDYYLDGASIARVGLERSRLTAASASARAAAIGLATQVKSQYVTALGAQDALDVALREVELAQENLDLASALVEIGAAPALEATQAEVALGRAQVEQLTAENNALNEKLQLLRLLGVELDRDVDLTSEFEVFDPQWTVDELVDLAIRQHPQLRALRANRDAGEAGVRAARLTYLPSLQMSAGWSGFAREVTDENSILESLRAGSQAQQDQCTLGNLLIDRLDLPISPEDCSRFILTPEAEAAALDANNTFPFGYEDQPFTARAQISLPIFQGFRRQAQIEEARVIADDARYALRAQELQLRTDVIAAHRTLETAYRAVQIEERNRELADQQLELSRERYRLGALSYIDLSESTTLKARADRAYLASVYAFHQALASLEAAVGRSLTSSPSEIE